MEYEVSRERLDGLPSTPFSLMLLSLSLSVQWKGVGNQGQLERQWEKDREREIKKERKRESDRKRGGEREIEKERHKPEIRSELEVVTMR